MQNQSEKLHRYTNVCVETVGLQKLVCVSTCGGDVRHIYAAVCLVTRVGD